MSVVVLLLSLSIGAYRYATTRAELNRSIVSHAGMLRCIEAYKAEFNDYPAPVNPDVTVTIDGVKFSVAGAMLLYQILSGDGTDQMVAGGKPSDGTIENDEPSSLALGLEWVKWKEVDGHRFTIDPHGHPYQYEKGGSADAVNPTYDAWSYDGDTATLGLRDAATKRDPAKTTRWIKNFPLQNFSGAPEPGTRK